MKNCTNEKQNKIRINSLLNEAQRNISLYNEKSQELLKKYRSEGLKSQNIEFFKYSINSYKEELEEDFSNEKLDNVQSMTIHNFIIQLAMLSYSFEQEIKNIDIEKETQIRIEEIQTTEHKILSHVLTLLGIFTAIIIIIVSAISTTTTWLNNASNVSFGIAIIIPAVITTFVIIILLTLLKIFFFKENPIKNDRFLKQKSKKPVEIIVLCISIVSLLIITIIYTILEINCF